MNQKQLLAFSLFPLLLASCADQAAEDYDVSNPYAAPDYGDGTATPSLPSDVNPAYDQPAVYEDTTPSVPPSVPAYTSPAPAAAAKVHTVVRGDSLWSIGKKYGVSIDSIKQANAMTRDIVVLGSKLNIPAQ
jgi:hypothetical protein